jgi:hypothetical protein
MIELKNVDLIAIDTRDPEDALSALKYSKRDIKFGNVFLLTDKDIEIDDPDIKIKKVNVNSYQDHGNLCLKLLNYTDNDYIIMIQTDGFILNGKNWKEEFLEYDYIGGPWPTHTGRGINRVGNGGFTLRSRKFLEFSNQFDFAALEDQFLCIDKYYEATAQGIRYAPPEVAIKFAIDSTCGHSQCPDIYDNQGIASEEFCFGFHGKAFLNYNDIQNKRKSIC